MTDYGNHFQTTATGLDDRNTGLRFGSVSLSRFERQIVTGNRCGALLNMKCVFGSEGMEIYYDTSGCIRLDEILRSGMTDTAAALGVCRAFLEALEICGDYLLSPQDLSFCDKNMFCSQDMSEVRFMYLPGYMNRVSVREKLTDIADTIIEFSDDEGGLIASLSEYKNRIYTCAGDVRSLTAATEEAVRKRAPVRILPQDNGGIIKTGTDLQENSGDAAALPAAFREEAAEYGRNSKIGRKLKNIFAELVS